MVAIWSAADKKLIRMMTLTNKITQPNNNNTDDIKTDN